MWVPVTHIDYDTLSHKQTGDGSDIMREKVVRAREFAKKRFQEHGMTVTKNKDLKAKDIMLTISLTEEVKSLMKKLATSYMLSPRAYHRVLRLARTIADCREARDISETDILEAFQYRPKLYQDKI